MQDKKMKIIEGNLITMALHGDFDVIVHGCNCFCQMGAGIALDIKYTFPKAYAADQQTVKGDLKKLGKISYSRQNLFVKDSPELIVVNGYTQYNYGGQSRRVDYKAMHSVFAEVKKHFSGKRIGYPAIGAGLARGNLNTILEIIEQELTGEDHTIVKFVK